MRITIDVEFPAWLTRAVRIAAPAVVIGMAGVALADVPHTFSAGEVLRAADLNADFVALDERLTAVESVAVPKVTSWSDETVTLTDSSGGGVLAGATVVAKSRRVGDSLEVVVSTSFPTGAPASTGYYVWTLPNRPAIDDGKLTTGYDTLGSSELVVQPGNTVWACIPERASAGVVVDCHGATGSVKAGMPTTIGNGSVLKMRFTVPMTGWTEATP